MIHAYLDVSGWRFLTIKAILTLPFGVYVKGHCNSFSFYAFLSI